MQKRACEVPFCKKYSSRTKDRFCSAHRSELQRRKITPFKQIMPFWAVYKCKVHSYLPLSSCYINSTTKQLYCKACVLKHRKDNYCPLKKKKYERKKRKQIKSSQLKTKYNISYRDYLQKLLTQNKQCKICSINIHDYYKQTGKKYFDVDHSHKDNKIRDLLCNTCNQGIGYLKDNINTIQSALNYLKKHA